MEIKRVQGGWEYDSIVFVDKSSAEKAMEANERDSGKPVNVSKPVLIYDEENPTSFGQFVVGILKSRSWSVAEFARQVKVTKQAFYAWINGDSMPHKAKVEKLIEVTGVSNKEILAALSTNIQKQAMELTNTSEEEYGEVIKGSGEIGSATKIAKKH